MGSYKRFCTEKATELNELPTSLTDSTPTPDEVSKVRKLLTQLTDRFDRMYTKWEVLVDEITDDAVYTKCEMDYKDSKVTVTRQTKAAEAFLKNAPTNGTVQPNVAGTTSVKIDELLQPKELLLLSMTLEEADQWFRNFRAFLKHNERALANQDISVIRALLNKSIEAKLSSTLRAHPDVEVTTLIADRIGCLDKLREMFLEKNQLWLRRHHYFKCIQQMGETVND